MRIFFFLLFLPSTILAQQNSTFGTVSGHVYCSDTQLPARLGRIVLSPIPDPPAAGPAAKKEQSEPRIVFAEIGLDGSFLFPHVTPGNYYVVADRPGYIAPESQFTDAEIGSLAPEMRELIAKSVPTISVVENKTTTIDVYLHRGAAISGILRYDDGSPVPMDQVDILRRDKTGQWVLLDTEMPPFTDDLGHFRISGLPAGEYILNSSFQSSGLLSIFGESDKPLNIYYGDVFFKKDAKSIKLTDGEEYSGADITFRLSKLHTISGSLTNVSGQPINSGHIALFTVPDNIQIALAFVDEDDATFYIDLVPEGQYTLRVTEARDVNVQVDRDTKDPNQISDIKRTTLQTYGDYQAPLEVTGDITGLNLTVPSRPSQNRPPRPARELRHPAPARM